MIQEKSTMSGVKAYGLVFLLSLGVFCAQGGAGFTARLSAQPAASARPIVFQAAGPTVATIQGAVDAFRAALGENNGNTPGPLATGRREINWDGGGSTATSPAPNPFDGFLGNRGARFTTLGTGFVQAPLDGLATTFKNPTYLNTFQFFSPVRLFSAVGSSITNARFFVPGGGENPATVSGFGAIFVDVDTQGPNESVGTGGRRRIPTFMSFFGADGRTLFTVPVPASEGDASLSFLGVLFNDARIARVRIRAGDVAPGPNDSSANDVAMMDDFIYGEPQAVNNPALLQLMLTQPADR
jgi:hypothetical protein